MLKLFMLNSRYFIVIITLCIFSLCIFSSCTDSSDEANNFGTINDRVTYLEGKIKSLETRYDILAKRSLERSEETHSTESKISSNPQTELKDEKSPVIENVHYSLDDGFFDDAFIGSSSPTVIIVIYSDLSCEKCVGYLPKLISSLRSTYKSNLNVQARLRDFPLDKYPHSTFLAEASHCVGEQGSYWNFIESILKHKATSKDDILKLAKDPDIRLKDLATLNRCLNSNKYSKEIAQDKKSGMTLGVLGVPSIFIGTKTAEKEFKGALIRGNQDISIIHKYVDHLLGANG